MKEECPSWTALRVAMHRAAHQIVDDPKVFNDSLAPLIVSGMSAPESDPEWPHDHPLLRGLRAFVVARSRYAEDELHNAVKRGVSQYVVLGAGLDTFAYRNPYPEGTLHVFEVDHPATQIWKRACIGAGGIPIPRTLTFTPIDFESLTLEAGLSRAGFDKNMSTFFSWLGVTPYLSPDPIFKTLEFVASLPRGSAIVFDYHISPSLLDPRELKVSAILAEHVAREGEPFQTSFDPSFLKNSLSSIGFGQVHDLDVTAINTRYFDGRLDGLRIVAGLSRLMNARV